VAISAAFNRLWSEPAGHKAIWAATTPIAAAYSVILAARARWWKESARRPPLPTISVGNLTVGGNGKTPFSLFLATLLRERGVRVAIVSRGYGGRSSRSAGLVSDGERLLMTTQQAGDEPVTLAKSFAGPVAVARRRIAAIELLAALRAADAVVLDDGFQHLRLRRDLDLLLINQAVGFGNGWLLPAGPMREPASAIARADAIVVIAASDEPASNAYEGWLSSGAAGHRLVVRASLQPSGLIRSAGGQWHQEPLQLDNTRVLVVSGVANPAGLHAMMRRMGANIISTADYPDHHDYSLRDWQKIGAAAEQAELIITTEKDLVKLEQFPPMHIPLYALRIAVKMDKREQEALLALSMLRIKH
jgi:tetraacyldisaccharide 4'-kinase